MANATPYGERVSPPLRLRQRQSPAEEPVRSWGLTPLPSSRETLLHSAGSPRGWLPKWSIWRWKPSRSGGLTTNN
ncbi:hypothetical protein [Mastigocladopsis repens]|uniref:hypothetical protein n=1 Tax=Mastigocladopsis repens TaxID=221287 RepID=UPI0002F7672F|nr:hypothetical protein [Mastigocladopsis repens]